MIITTDESEKRQSVSLSTDHHHPHGHGHGHGPSSPSSDDPPPRYTPLNDLPPPPPPPPNPPSPSPSSPRPPTPPSDPPLPTLPQRPPTPLPRATNNINITRVNGPIRDLYVIDPYLSLPPSFLPPLPPGEERKNLDVKSVNGSVYLDVRVVGREGRGGGRRKGGKGARLGVRSVNGAIEVVFHETQNRPPTTLTAHTQNGQITLSLPRSFKGPVRLTTHNGRVRFSEGVRDKMMVGSEERGCVRGYLGWDERSESADDRREFNAVGGEGSTERRLVKFHPSLEDDEEEGDTDMLEVESRNGGVFMQYIDEALRASREREREREEGRGRRGWLRWLSF
ncbi:hypothetical protein BDQ17DRAFT_1411313 [Cyathus striatus]|nr:hypothetical protein BDQ17DRAFT_1411313 [Cyathus striatus]